MITAAQLEVALRSSAGIYSVAAEKLQTTRQNVFQRVQRSPALKALCAEIEEMMLDMAEAGVVDALNKKDRRMITWYLERKGRHRGYANKTEITGENGGPVQTAVEVTIQYVDAPKTEEPS